MHLTGLLIPLSSPIGALKMCPPLTIKNWASYQPFAGVGCNNGIIQICDVANGSVVKEIAVHNYPVKGNNEMLVAILRQRDFIVD